jgi:hypothetical protein
VDCVGGSKDKLVRSLWSICCILLWCETAYE